MSRIVYVLNGPNLNLLGKRQPHIYGHETLADVECDCRALAKELNLELRFEQNSLALSIRDYSAASQSRMDHPQRRLIARVPLDVRLLSRFQVPDETADSEAAAKTQARYPADAPNISFFEHNDEAAGLIWHLCRQEFTPREGSRSRTVDAGEVRHRA